MPRGCGPGKNQPAAGEQHPGRFLWRQHDKGLRKFAQPPKMQGFAHFMRAFFCAFPECAEFY